MNRRGNYALKANGFPRHTNELNEAKLNEMQTITPDIQIAPRTHLPRLQPAVGEDINACVNQSSRQVSLSQFGNVISQAHLPTVIGTNPLTLEPILWPQPAAGQTMQAIPGALLPPSVTPPPTLVVPQQVVPLSNYTNSILQSNSNPTPFPNLLQPINGNVPTNPSSALSSGISPSFQPQIQSQLQQPQLPILAIQDHPLINPVYNGVNPAYPGLRVLNQYPPIFAVDSFLTHSECDFLISVAQDSFSPAPVVGKGSGEVSPSRTSTTCYLAREDLPIYMEKICALTGKPVDHCELPQVGRYLPSQQYLQHFDAFDVSNEDGRRFVSNGGQRTVTVLVYLNKVENGGGTSFPVLNLEVKPKKGMAIVFFPATVDGLLDKMVLHAAKPAIDTKYVSQVWIRQGHYDGLPSKRMFSSVEQATVVQKSLLLPTHNVMTNFREAASNCGFSGSNPSGITN